jgi:hypothetical protein
MSHMRQMDKSNRSGSGKVLFADDFEDGFDGWRDHYHGAGPSPILSCTDLAAKTSATEWGASLRAARRRCGPTPEVLRVALSAITSGFSAGFRQSGVSGAAPATFRTTTTASSQTPIVWLSAA